MADEPESEFGDPWLDQFMAGQARKEARAKSTGWSLVIAFVLVVLFIVMLASSK